MTLTQLEYILAVAKFKHFGKAAESCFVTQPTLSMQIQKLEAELDVIIFDRSKTPIAVSDDGSLIVEQAKTILFEQNKLLTILDEAKQEITGDFKLGVIPTLSPYILPLFITEFVKNYPKVRIQITENTTENIIDLLKEDKLDGGLLVTPLHEKNIIERPLYYEPFYLFTSKENPISKKVKIREEDLNIDEIWLLNKGNCFRDQVLNICDQGKGKALKNPLNIQSGNFETLKNMVLNGSGYTILPHMAVEQLSAQHQKLVRPFIRPVPTREVALVHNKRNIKKRILDALEEEILASIPDDLRPKLQQSQQVIEIY